MRWKVLSERIERSLERGEEELRLSRAAAERHAMAFERLMSAFDRHEKAFERHEKAFERHEQAFERHEQGFERVIAALDRHEEKTEDLRIFIRDMNTRSEKVVQDLIRGNQEFCRELNTKVDAKSEAILAELKEGREEARAQREALLALIDRLPPPAEAA